MFNQAHAGKTQCKQQNSVLCTVLPYATKVEAVGTGETVLIGLRLGGWVLLGANKEINRLRGVWYRAGPEYSNIRSVGWHSIFNLRFEFRISFFFSFF